MTEKYIKMTVSTTVTLILSVSYMDDIRYEIYSRLTTMTEEYGYFVRETQDRTYAPGNNRNDPGDDQVTGLEQHKVGHLHIHTVVVLLTGLNPPFFLGKCFNDWYMILSVSNMDD